MTYDIYIYSMVLTVLIHIQYNEYTYILYNIYIYIMILIDLQYHKYTYILLYLIYYDLNIYIQYGLNTHI